MKWSSFGSSKGQGNWSFYFCRHSLFPLRHVRSIALCKTFVISLPIFIVSNLPKLIADVWVSYPWQAGGLLVNVCGSPKLMFVTARLVS